MPCHAEPCHARPFQTDKRAPGEPTRTLNHPATPSAGRQGSRCVGMNSAGEESFRFTAPTDRPTTNGGLSITGACVRAAAAPGCVLGGCALHSYARRWGGSAGGCESAHQQRLADNKIDSLWNRLLAWRSLLLCVFGGRDGGRRGVLQLSLPPCWVPEAAAASPHLRQLAQRLARLNCANLLVTDYPDVFTRFAAWKQRCMDGMYDPCAATSSEILSSSLIFLEDIKYTAYTIFIFLNSNGAALYEHLSIKWTL